MAIFVRRLYEDDQYARVEVDGRDILTEWNVYADYEGLIWFRAAKVVSVRQNLVTSNDVSFGKPRLSGFRRNESLLQTGNDGEELFSFDLEHDATWNSSTRVLQIPNGTENLLLQSTIDISRQRKRIRKIKFGFDVDSRPTIFMAEASAIPDMKEYTDAYRIEAMRASTSFKATTTEDFQLEAYPSFAKSFFMRHPNDKGGWNNVVRGVVNAQSKGTGRPGLWALKADRIDGLDVNMYELDDSKISVGHVLVRRGEIDGALIWDVSIEDLAPEVEEVANDTTHSLR